MDWVRWMYREEKLHTSVLAELLDRAAGQERSAVVEALLAFDSPGKSLQAAVVESGTEADAHTAPVQLESRVTTRPGRKTRRSVDLSCLLKVDGTSRRLLVESKVDSAANRDQLADMSWINDHTLLLALGVTAITSSQADLDRDADLTFLDTSFADEHLGSEVTPATVLRRGPLPRAWTVITPERWAQVLRAAQAEDSRSIAGLGAYVERIELEARLHERAFEDAQRGGIMEDPPSDPSHRATYDRGRLLTAAAWCNLVRGWLSSTKLVRGGELNLVTDRRGDLFKTVVHPQGWGGDGCDVYLEVAASTQADGRIKPSLALKAGGAHAFRQAMCRPAGAPPSAARATAKTTTLNTVSRLSGHPQDAVDWLVATIGSLDEHVTRVRAEHVQPV